MTPLIQFTSDSPGMTRKTGETIGASLTESTVIALNGDLGAGKTVFVQGLASGLEVSEDYIVTSPTYTIINEYPGRLQLYHVKTMGSLPDFRQP